ncbi:MAG: metal-dependent phosphohydrolase, partial [Lachnospiraceae bacterium]|nr:metal-dependent phosphohydrolase [Lachnospiraceae bacterium]
EAEVSLAWSMGMLHDIGRFEQCKRYDTFNDSQSINHAEFGCELLFGQDMLIKRFGIDEGYYKLIHDAIFYHSSYRLPDDMDAVEERE